jgi:hypothetical protein
LIHVSILGWPYVFIVASKEIQKDMELLLDYNLDSYWVPMVKTIQDRQFYVDAGKEKS